MFDILWLQPRSGTRKDQKSTKCTRYHPPSPPPVLAVTPHSAQDVIKFGQWFESLLHEQAFVIPEGMRQPLARFVKGSIANGYSRQIAERDLEVIRKEAIVKRARKTLSGTVAQKGGWMAVDQIRKSLTVVEETAKEKAEKVWNGQFGLRKFRWKRQIRPFGAIMGYGSWCMIIGKCFHCIAMWGKISVE